MIQEEVPKDESSFKSIENFTKVSLPMLRKSFDKNIINSLVLVQPMSSISGNIFTEKQRQAEKVEYEEIYETLPESDESSIQVGEGWGPRLIGKRNKRTGVLEIDLRDRIRRGMEEDRQEEEKLFPDIA